MLDPSRRVLIIREIARHLESEKFNVLNMILGQFSIPTSHRGMRSNHDYLIEVLSTATSESLQSLAAHLRLDQPEPAPSSKIWDEGHFRLFVCHLAQHKHEVGELRNFLKNDTTSAFVAHNDIEPTEEWQSVILDALSTADAMVALLHKGFHDSKWTDQEIGYALGRKILVIPVRLGIDPSGFIGRFQGANGMNKPLDQLSREIVGILTRHPLSRKRMAETLVYRFEHSASFAGARKNARDLAGAEYWDSSLTERCNAAYESNNQISGITGVRGSLEVVFQKWGGLGVLASPPSVTRTERQGKEISQTAKDRVRDRA